MPRVDTEFGCPTCRDAGVKSRIVAVDGTKIVCSENSTHTWTDRMEFTKLCPTMDFAVVKAQFAPQVGHVEMKVQVPLGVKTKLEAKFAGKTDATVAGILQMLSEGEILIIPQGDMERMKQRFGKKPESSGELFGLIFSMGLDKDNAELEAKNARDKLEAFMAKHEGYVALNLGELYHNAVSRAIDANEPLDSWCETQFKNGLANNWF